MTRKKAKRTAAAKKPARKKISAEKKQKDPAKVREEIAGIVKSGAKKITVAVMDQAMQGELAPAKYLLEMAGVYPPATDGTLATAEEESLAKTLLRRLDLPDEPITHDEETGAAKTTPAKREKDEQEADTECEGQDPPPGSSEPKAEATGEEKDDVALQA
jgi:hypothetical protein